MMSASEYTGEPSTWYDQGLASDMTARLPFCDCRGDTTVNGAASAVHGLRLGRAVRMLVTTRVHAIMDTIWPLGFMLIAVVSFLLSAGSGVAGRRVLVLVFTAV